MKIIANRDILSENINIVLKAVSSRTTMQILECILISADEEQGLRLTGNDLEIEIRTNEIDSEIIEHGQIALEAKLFSDIVRRLPPGDVTIQTNKDNTTLIKSQKSEFKILGLSGDEFPLLTKIDKTEAYKIQSISLKNIIRQTIFSVATDNSKPTITGELLEIKDNKIKFVAIDGFRVSLRQVDMEDNSNTDYAKAIIPSKTLNEISKIITSNNEEITDIYLSENHILFDLKSCIVVSRLIEGEFINYENIMMSDYTTSIYVARKTLLESLERASLIGRDVKKTPTKLEISHNKIIITSSAETGNTYDEISATVDGTPLEIAFNPRYLIDALKAIDEDDITIQFTTPLSPCIIKSEEDESYKYLILPLRL